MESGITVMTRNDFMKCCASGVCSCGALALVAPPGARAEGDPEITRRRFGRLVEILSQYLDEASRNKVWEALGRDHGKEYRGLTDKYKGDLPGFLAEIQKQWVEIAEYDAAAGTIRIVDKATACTCPLVDPKLTPPGILQLRNRLAKGSVFGGGREAGRSSHRGIHLAGRHEVCFPDSNPVNVPRGRARQHRLFLCLESRSACNPS